MNEEYLIWLEENVEFAMGIYDQYYHEKAEEEGEMMQGDDRYYEDDVEMSNGELYEDFAHCTGHSANYHGAYGVIKETGEGMLCDPDDEELQWEVLLILGQEPM